MSSEDHRLRRNRRRYRLQYRLRRIRDAMPWASPKVPLPRHFVFLHIPKAGGSSLRLFFADLFGGRALYPESALALPRPYSEVACATPRLYMGHVGHRFAADAGAIRATVMRNPIERVLSVYSYTMNPGKRPPLIGGLRTDMSLLEFLNSDNPGIRMNIDNAQTWQLGYGYTPEDRAAFTALNAGPILDVAAANLASMEHVGVLENLQRFQHQVLDAYGAPRKADRRVINSSLSRLKWTDLSGIEKAALEALIEDDLQLYELARQRGTSSPAN